MKQVALFDTECYPNFWLLKFRPIGGKSYAFRITAGLSFDTPSIHLIRHLFATYTVISFNGINYDVAMITGALIGYTPEQLKVLNDRMIVEKVRHWKLGLPEWRPADHIDIKQVIPGKGGLKYKAAIIHAKTIRELPYPVDQALNAEQINHVEDYCENDLDLLEVLYNYIQPQIEMRVELSARYSVDLRSHSDAQIAETVLKLRCEAALGVSLSRLRIDPNISFKYDVPEFITYQAGVLKKALDVIKDATFMLGDDMKVGLPKGLKDYKIPTGSIECKLGIGGIHGSESKTSHVADDTFMLKDLDVASYYPSLIINSGEWPEALGAVFLLEYAALKSERLEQKAIASAHKKLKNPVWRKAATWDAVGKIVLNGTFGKLLSAYSILFAPKMGIQTTITGQLSLLMLIEWHEYYGIPVISANTDGIVIKCPRDKEYISKYLVAEWEKRTGLQMEESLYSAIYTRDVNNYIAVYTNGDIKRKGEYGKGDLIYKKAPGEEICSDAVIEYLTKGIPIETTVKGCRDITKFITTQQVDKGSNKMWGHGPLPAAKAKDILPVLLANGWIKQGRRWIKPGMSDAVLSGEAYEHCFAPQRPEYLGKVIRWYYSTQAPGPIVNCESGNTIPLSYGAKPCMTLPDEFPSDIDYEWYLKKCLTILKDVGYSDATVNKE